MALKLFRSTEFAESRNFSPQVQRRALHPGWLLFCAALWISTAGNWVFWHHLMQTHTTGLASLAWLMLRLVLLIGAAGFGVLVLFMWRWSAKPAAFMLLLITALAGNLLAGLPLVGSWRSVLSLTLVALVPLVLLWRTPLRRLAMPGNLLQVLSAAVAALAVFALALLLSFKDLARLQEQLPQWQEQISPYHLVGAVRRLEKMLLLRK